LKGPSFAFLVSSFKRDGMAAFERWKRPEKPDRN